MRRMAILLLVLLLAGCAGNEPAGESLETGDDEGRQSTPGSGGRTPDNTTRVWQHQVTYSLDGSPPPATMDVPANVTGLRVRVISTVTAPCGANVGDGPDAPLPFAEFVAPSGEATRVTLLANECHLGVVYTTSGSPGTALDTEQGQWQVTFRGRGAGLQQTILVEGEKTA
jgi:hypothetical protein